MMALQREQDAESRQQISPADHVGDYVGVDGQHREEDSRNSGRHIVGAEAPGEAHHQHADQSVEQHVDHVLRRRGRARQQAHESIGTQRGRAIEQVAAGVLIPAGIPQVLGPDVERLAGLGHQVIVLYHELAVEGVVVQRDVGVADDADKPQG